MNAKEIGEQLAIATKEKMDLVKKIDELTVALTKAIEDENRQKEVEKRAAIKLAIFKLWEEFWSDEDNTEYAKRLNSINDISRLYLWLKYDVKTCLKICKLEKLDEIKEICSGIDFKFDKCIKDAEIRLDFASALKGVRYGSNLAKSLDWGFDSDDLMELMKLHKANKFRKKIEDLLENCNFHGECGLLHEKKYDEFVKYVEEDK